MALKSSDDNKQAVKVPGIIRIGELAHTAVRRSVLLHLAAAVHDVACGWVQVAGRGDVSFVFHCAESFGDAALLRNKGNERNG